MIKQQGHDGTYVLVDDPSQMPVAIGEEVCSQDGHGMTTAYKLEGGRAPHKPGSTGRIWVRESPEHHQCEYFPNVCNLAWVREDHL